MGRRDRRTQPLGKRSVLPGTHSHHQAYRESAGHSEVSSRASVRWERGGEPSRSGKDFREPGEESQPRLLWVLTLGNPSAVSRPPGYLVSVRNNHTDDSGSEPLLRHPGTQLGQEPLDRTEIPGKCLLDGQVDVHEDTRQMLLVQALTGHSRGSCA